MIAAFLRYVKRSLVFIPGLIIAYIAVKNIYPEIRQHDVPAFIALLATYVLVAYFLIPTAIRLFRLFQRPKHIPLYSTTPDGFASDPINIGIIASQAELTTAMTQAGWFLAEKRSLTTIYKLIHSYLFNRPYSTAPFSNLYLFGRKQDLGFQLPVGPHVGMRHHVRFWATDLPTSEYHKHQQIFWKKHAKHSTKTLWVGAALLDTGLGIIRHNAQLTHHIHPNTDQERDLIVSELKSTGLIKKTTAIKVGTPYQLKNRVLNGYLRADGKMTICEL